MKKMLLALVCGVSLIMPRSEYNEYENVESSFDHSVQIEVIIDDNSLVFNKGTYEYNGILNEFKKMIFNSHEVPSLGVSLDELTREEKKKGVWIEFKFNEISYSRDMPFESLLVNVNLDFYGFNVIRKYEGKYEGRTYYINLVNNMDNLYYYLVNNYGY